MTHTTFARRRQRLRARQENYEHIHRILTTMKSWKTTIVGALLAGLAFLSIYQSNGGDLAHWQQWVLPFLIAALGWVAKDSNVSGTDSLNIEKLSAKETISQRDANVTRVLLALLFVGIIGFMLAGCSAVAQKEISAELEASGRRVLKAGTAATEAAVLEEIRRRVPAKQPVNVTP
jgi:hypothetical protein